MRLRAAALWLSLALASMTGLPALAQPMGFADALRAAEWCLEDGAGAAALRPCLAAVSRSCAIRVPEQQAACLGRAAERWGRAARGLLDDRADRARARFEAELSALCGRTEDPRCPLALAAAAVLGLRAGGPWRMPGLPRRDGAAPFARVAGARACRTAAGVAEVERCMAEAVAFCRPVRAADGVRAWAVCLEAAAAEWDALAAEAFAAHDPAAESAHRAEAARRCAHLLGDGPADVTRAVSEMRAAAAMCALAHAVDATLRLRAH